MLNQFVAIMLFLGVSQLFAYENGESFCEKNPLVGVSKMHTIQDESLSSQFFKIHSYTKKTFDLKKETILFFSGGPGTSPRSMEFDLTNYNVIFFEPRGTGCSRPSSSQDFLNPKFYSSKKIASDALRILEDYGVEQVILYGHSYGTVVASIFASQYPSKTKKVILEGVIGVGDLGLWKSERRRSLLQNLYDELPLGHKVKIQSYNQHDKIPESWFSVIGTMMSYLDNGFHIYKNFLSNVLNIEEDSFVSLVNNFYSQKGFLHTTPELAADGEVFFGMITCQELSGSSHESSMNLIFDQQMKLQWNNENLVRESYCKALGLENINSNIDLSSFPIFVPVVYLTGESDGATDLEQATYHFLNVARGEKDFYTLSSGGHLPNLSALKDNRSCYDEEDCKSLAPLKTQIEFFEKILTKNSSLTESEISYFNQNLELNWVIKK